MANDIKFDSPEHMASVAREKYNTILAGKSERLVSGSDDQTLCIWEYPKTSTLILIHIHIEPINRMAGH